ncbi:hypothetical protein E1A91_D05G409900v1 [Gossypium mustelinum]|uniref:NB-ARC domain-containing protein n=1 Tax=Gossypium mustelinum TaxID=34275 RepID=A0A5D2V6N8_GOSMU|nr:hypothetical protein E1A91_D05G409900v1 [Gossypium mustelinum]
MERVKEIPNFICLLQNLQTLILDGCTTVEELPRDVQNLSGLTMQSITTKQRLLPENGVGRLICLRFLAITGCQNLKYLPQGIHLLTSLTTLIFRDCNTLTLLTVGRVFILFNININFLFNFYNTFYIFNNFSLFLRF